MTEKERLEQLMEHGCTIQLLYEDWPKLTLLLGAVLWVDEPRGLKWCGTFPEHQGHVHTVPYDRIDMVNDGRDMAFYLGSVFMAYIAPYEESGLDLSSVQEELANWRNIVAYGENKKYLRQFMEDA